MNTEEGKKKNEVELRRNAEEEKAVPHEGGRGNASEECRWPFMLRGNGPDSS
jgi:hypothetical protein